jgi:hypothetical protein
VVATAQMVAPGPNSMSRRGETPGAMKRLCELFRFILQPCNLQFSGAG